jgi:putative ABC transport system permease protein
MSGLVRNWQKLTFTSRRTRLEQELAEELELHRELKTAELERTGMTHEAAFRQGRREMGNLTLARENSREQWSFMGIERLLQDLKYAVRMFAKTPVFTTVAVASLALGIGGNAAMFSLVNTLLIRPLPFKQPERLVRVTGVYPRAAVPYFQERSRQIDIAAVGAGTEFNLTGQGLATRLTGSTVSTNFFSILGVAPERGRSFERGEDAPGRNELVIISHSLWQTRFGGDPSIVGRVIALNEVKRQIVGVMPETFTYPSANVQFWIPMRLDSSNFLEFWAGEFVPFIGRLRPGATLTGAQQEVRSLMDGFRKTIPYPMSRDWNADATAIPLQQDVVGDIKGRLLILLASVGIVLLIACANVAGLLFSRAMARRKEIALRASLGAGRLRILRQLLTESAALSLCGGALGLILGAGALSIFKSVLPAATPGLAQVSLDSQVTAAVAVLSLIVGVGFGLAPALSVARPDLTERMKTGSQRSTRGFWTTFRTFLISTEVALSLVLVVAAGLLLRSVVELSESKTGIEARNLITVRVSPNQASCAVREACIAFYDRVLKRIGELPGMRGVAAVNAVPLDGQFPTLPVDVEGRPKTADHPSPMLFMQAVTPGYRSLLNIPLLAGRDLNAGDSAKANPVMLISAATARHFWPGQNPIGKHIKPAGSSRWRTVVGVVADVKHSTLRQGLPSWVPGTIYMPHAQSEREDGQMPAAMTLVIKASFDQAKLKRDVADIVRDQDPSAPVGTIERVEDIVARSISDDRSTMRLLSVFALTAIGLAAIGIYGLMAYSVSQRTYEIGLRVAIGATRTGIVAMILGHGLRVTLWGVLAGLAGASALTRFLRALLFGVGATDIATFISTTSLVLAVAMVATAIPAWRASLIDPAISLKVE